MGSIQVRWSVLNTTQGPIERWWPLRFFHLLRLLLAAILLLLALFNQLPLPLGIRDPNLFAQGALLYLLALLLTIPLLLWQRPHFHHQISMQVLIDAIFVTLLMYASGGVASGVAMLMVISVANHSMLSSGRMTLFLAALATIALLLEQSYTLFLTDYHTINYPYAALFGVVLFSTAQLTRVMAQRTSESEALARQRGIDLENMAELAQYVITQLDDGVVVLDGAYQIRMANRAAGRLLETKQPLQGWQLQQIAPELVTAIGQWRSQRDMTLLPLTLSSGQRIQIHCHLLGATVQDGVLLVLEDLQRSLQQAQQLKLAALGQLTASIAHEIRNPLGAISHASELLRESEDLAAVDRRLSEIIHDHSYRLNQIIESILVLGRRESPLHQQWIPLASWLPKLVASLQSSLRLAPEELVVVCESAALQILFDEGHLFQLLWNLCKNGLHHADPDSLPKVWLLARPAAEAGRVAIWVVDSGSGIEAAALERLFEPFYTTRHQGTGLGLYLSKTLADANRAELRYQRTERGESAFVLCGSGEPQSG